MAHQFTRDEVDQLAATEAASITTQEETAASEAPPAQTTLAYGATGECVQKLVDLLAVLGYTTNATIKGGPPLLDDSVLTDVHAAQQALGITEPEVTIPADIPVGVKGELVGTATWNALYTAAAEKLTPPAGSDASGASTT